MCKCLIYLSKFRYFRYFWKYHDIFQPCVKVKLQVRLFVAIADPPMYAESLTGAVDIRDEDDDQLGSVGDYMFTPMYTYVYDYRYRCPPAYSEVSV